MKLTGIVRSVDSLGRVVLPAEIRRMMNIESKDSVKISIDSKKIIMEKVEISCILCGSRENLSPYNGKHICEQCIDKVSCIH